jgi:hypothetical protein
MGKGNELSRAVWVLPVVHICSLSLTASHHAALGGLRLDINTGVCGDDVVAASVVVAANLVWIRNSTAAIVEGPAIDTAAMSSASYN